jgi:CelD/BcsL family acetyltransferase involved in cellulose biosynthesis
VLLAETRQTPIETASVQRVPAAAAASLVPQWRALAERAAEPNVFLGPDFLLPNLACFAPSAQILAVRDLTERLIGIAPLASERLASGLTGAVPVIWCNDYAPLGTPLVEAGAIRPFWRAVFAHVGQTHGVLAMRDLRVDGPVFAGLAEVAAEARFEVHVVGSHPRAALAGPETWDAYLDRSIDRKRRKDHARKLRRLTEQGSAVIDVVTDPARVTEVFEDFLALEASGWKGRAGSALVLMPEAAQFARTAVRALADAGAVAIDRISLDGRLIAAVVRVSSAGRVWPWKTAYAEAHAVASPGIHVMMQATARMLADPRFAGADSLAVTDHPMIDHLWRDRVEIGTVVVDLGTLVPRGRLVAADIKAWIGLRRAAKRAMSLMARELDRFGR